MHDLLFLRHYIGVMNVRYLYLERDEIMQQMYLSLCLNCSKDYILLRNNHAVWKKFINSILGEDVEDEETVWIPIGNRELAFTAIHLAEIQAILELEEIIKV